ncbi:MAG: pyridoxal-phosphate dependent enzyme, partial [Candidatus Izemoplasmatales bacterium]
MAVYNNILETIGATPLVRLNKIESKYNLNVNIYAKLESFNPANNVKTRPAYYMIKKLYEDNIIDETYKLIEASSGNTGIGLAMVGAYLGNEVTIVMPDSVSKERTEVLKLYGARVILTPGDLGMTGANDFVKKMTLEENKAIQPSQFT